MNPTINITCETDVRLNVTLMHQGEVIIPQLIDNLQAYLISGIGVRTPLQANVKDDYIKIDVPWAKGRLGCHSLMLKGYINALAWAAVGKAVIRYTSATEKGDDNVTLQADAYDITMEVGYHYSDSPIARVEATIDDQVGTPSVDVSYVRKVLGFAFHNMKGEKGEDGATGPQGIQGTSAIWNGNAEVLTELEQTTGGATNRTMSQKAITDEITTLLDSWTKSGLETLTKQWWINASSLRWRSTTGNNYAVRVNVRSYRGQGITITPQSGKSCQVAFLTAWGTSADTDVTTFCSGTSLMAISEAQTVTIPSDAVYMYIAWLIGGENILPSTMEIRSRIASSVDSLSEAVEDISEEMDAISDSGILELATELYVVASVTATKTSGTNTYNISSSNKYESPGKNGARYINISQYKGMKFRIIPQEGKHAYFAFIDTIPVSGATVSYAGDGGKNDITSAVTMVVPAIDGNVYLWYNYNKDVDDNDVCPSSVDVVKTFAEELESEMGKPSIIYVSENSGDDNNPGTNAKPVSTIEAAMSKGGSNLKIVLKSSTTKAIDFSAWDGMKSHVTLCGARNTRGMIRVGKMLTELEAVVGFEDVYEWTPEAGESLPSGDYMWLWQHGLPDDDTAIPNAEIHPLQRRRGYRRVCTRLSHASSLESLLAASKPRWFVSEGKLYVRVAYGSDISTNPICIPSGDFAIKAPTSYDLTLCSIECLYGNIIADGGHLFEAYDCAVHCTTGEGSWEIDGCLSAHLERCEADSNTMASSTSGDGFNMHPTAATNKYARTGTHTLINCWAHDNRDDGYSDHGWTNGDLIGGADGSIIGGLFEYNNKGGLTPSTGVHDTISGAVCRFNTGRGILYTGDNGGGDVHCIGCVCYGNSVNFECKSGAAGAGDNNNVMVLEHCVSRDASEAGYIVGKNSTMHLHDCLDRGSAVVKKTENGGVFVVENGTLVS